MITEPSTDGADETPVLRQAAWSALGNRHSWLILLLGLAVTAGATLQMKSGVDRIAALNFTYHCDLTQARIINRLEEYARLLQGGAAFFEASKTVTHRQWRIFSRSRKIEQQLPGIQGVGFARLISPADVARPVRGIRSERFPEYTLEPDGDTGFRSSITYYESFSGRNLRAFGYDLLSEPVCREAMAQARDTGSAALSGKISMPHDINGEVQAGAIMYLPVYGKGLPLDTVAQRRAALHGWLFSPNLLGNMMLGIVDVDSGNVKQQLQLQLFDGTRSTNQNLLFENLPALDKEFAEGTRQIQVNGRLWTLCFSRIGGGYGTRAYFGVWLTMAAGFALTTLLFVLIRSLLKSHVQARRIAEKMTADLQESQEFTTNVMDSLPSTVAVLDAKGIIIAVNESWRNFAAKDNGNSCAITTDLGTQYLDLQRRGSGEHCEDTIAAAAGIRAVLLGEVTVFTMEYDCSSPVEPCWITICASRLKGRRPGVVVIHTDITRRKELAAEVQHAREYAENIVETVRKPLVVLDSELRILSVNQSFCCTFKVTPLETNGNFIYDLGNGQWNSAELRLLFEKILPGESMFYDYEVDHCFPVIGRKIFLLNAHEISRKNIGSHIILLVMEDITEQKRIAAAVQGQAQLLQQEVAERRNAQELQQQQQLQLESLNRELEERVAEGVSRVRAKDQALMQNEKMVSLGQMAAGVAHEINSPMGYIASNLSVLAKYFDQIILYDRIRHENYLHESPSSTGEKHAMALEIETILEDGVDLIKESMEGAKRVTKIVQELKDFSRMDPLKCEVVELISCLESSLTIVYNQLKYVATIRKEYDSQQEVICHPGQLSQVFLNLLVNAGQAIVASTLGEIVLKSWHDDAFVYVSVSDTGNGITEEVKGRIFEPFFTTKEVGKGTGLGLSISSQIIKKHGGELLVESVVGVGSTFTVKLPCSPGETP